MHDEGDDNDESERGKKLIEAGSEIAGAAAGGAIGFFVGGPAGAIGGGPLGVIIARVTKAGITEFANRFLSQREEVRVGAAASFAIAKIKERIYDGQQPRQDEFFTEQVNGRTPAEEIFEGVLLKSKNEYEERKISLLGNFYANLVFAPEVSLDQANHMLHVAEELTFRQMFLLAEISDKDHLEPEKWRAESVISDERLTFDMVSILLELFALYVLGLVALIDRSGSIYIPISGWQEIVPSRLVVTPFGKRLIDLLGMLDIVNEAIRASAMTWEFMYILYGDGKRI